MADFELREFELRGFHQENREQLEKIKEEILKVNTRFHEVKGQIKRAKEGSKH